MMYYKNHTHGARLRIFFWHLLMNFEKPKKSEISKKKKKNTGDIIILHVCTKNYNQVQCLRYGVTQFFCHLGPLFALYPAFNTPENQNFEKK